MSKLMRPAGDLTPADLIKFLEELYAFVPSNSVLCLDGVYAPDIECYLKERPSSVVSQSEIQTREFSYY